MEITFQYTGQLANVVGASEETVELGDDPTLKPAIDQLAQRHGESYANLVLDGAGNLRPSLLVVVDGEQADGDRANLDLSGVKTIMLMTPIAGG
ncbi:MAG: molybdopterin converting factor small subunit [Verrucomicrobiales bacterium]|jgi:molybdopterin converting factor small subunit